jgi:hypothetical protein
MEKTATLSDYKLEGMSSVLESTLNGIIRLSETVMHQFSEIERRLINLENTKISTNKPQSPLPSPEYSSPSNLTPPLSSKTSKSVSRRGSEKARGAVLKELKELIEKRSR